MIRALYISLLFLATTGSLYPQRMLEDIHTDNHTYVDYIKTVQLYPNGLPEMFPMLSLGRTVPLMLTFDDLSEDDHYFTYTIVHCDRNWNISEDITELDYIDGYTENPMNDFSYSNMSATTYTHYQLQIPNQDMRPKLSGNYLLIVYDDTDDRRIALTRRFVVLDPQVQVEGKFVFPALASKKRTHQEIDFIVDHENYNIRQPRNDIRAAILQNQRWDNAVMDLEPAYIRPNTLLFDYQNKIVFPGGKDFRFADLRSLRVLSPTIADIEETPESIHISLMPDSMWANKNFIRIPDLDGQFIIDNFDQRNAKNTADYVETLFSLKVRQPLYEQDVYLFGAFTDYALLPQYKMVYNPAYNAYVGKALLKQGYYDYTYVAVNPKDDPLVPNRSITEGDSYEASNNYTILIYHRPFGARYDQLIGHALMFSDN